MAVPALALREALAEAVGREHVVSDPALLSAYAVDEVTPRWVARPGSVAEVSRLLALAAAEDLGVAPRGSGSSLGLGNPPRRVDLVLDCRRLGDVLEYAPEDMVATVQSGIALGRLAQRLAVHRQRLPLDPLGGADRTVGGVLASNASGLLRFRYGTCRDLLLGVRFVQADGTVTWGGAKVVKSVTGYDLPKLLVGSLGTLGVIVEATLRLHPIPPATSSWLFECPSREPAAALLAHLLDSTVQPDRLALVNAEALAAAGERPSPAAVAVSVSSVEDAVRSQGEDLGRLGSAVGARPAPLPEEFWPRLGAALDGPVRLKLASPASRLPHWLGEVEGLAARRGVRVSAVGEAGTGVLRVCLTGPLSPESWEREWLAPLREGVAAQGGSVVVERAPRDLKASTDAWGLVAAEASAIMRRVKAEFDPRGVLNPGRFACGI